MGFWKASLMKDKALLEMARSEEAMGHLGKITSLKDLPSDKKLKAYIKEAMELFLTDWMASRFLQSRNHPLQKKKCNGGKIFH